MFVINPNEFLLPSFGVTPFRTDDVVKNYNLPEDCYSTKELDNRFGKDSWRFTYNGKEAISFALSHYDLQKNDLVTILTTSQNLYISSCVTLEIERMCNWNRKILPETKVILVNHEFGYPYKNMDYLVSLGLPIIEDCCTTFFSQDENNKIGKYGDFTIYSLPKIFPIQIGGILTSNKSKLSSQQSKLSNIEIQYITNVLSYNLRKTPQILNKRNENFEQGLKLFSRIGFTERFKKNKAITPYAMLLKNNSIIKDLNLFKLFMNKNGIQNSVFYGEDAFFIPNHQSLNFLEIQFIFEVVCFYLKNNNS